MSLKRALLWKRTGRTRDLWGEDCCHSALLLSRLKVKSLTPLLPVAEARLALRTSCRGVIWPGDVLGAAEQEQLRSSARVNLSGSMWPRLLITEETTAGKFLSPVTD